MADKPEHPFEYNLGRFVMNFGALEHLLLTAIADLAKGDVKVKETTRVDDKFFQRIRLFQKLARGRIKDTAVKVEHTSIIAEMKRLANTRNHYVHGAWLDLTNVPLDAMKGKIIRGKKRLTMKDLYQQFQGEGVTPPQIAKVANETNAVFQRFRDHVEKLKKD